MNEAEAKEEAAQPPSDNEAARFRALFQEAPVSLWEEDFAPLGRYFDELRAAGVADIRAYLADHPEDLIQCVKMIRIISVNRATLELYEAPDEGSLRACLGAVFTEGSQAAFRETVIALFEGRQRFEIETVNRTLRGRALHVKLKWSLLKNGPGRPARALVAIEDITERKRAEEALRDSQRFLETIIESAPT